MRRVVVLLSLIVACGPKPTTSADSTDGGPTSQPTTAVTTGDPTFCTNTSAYCRAPTIAATTGTDDTAGLGCQAMIGELAAEAADACQAGYMASEFVEEGTEQCCLYYKCDDTPRVCLPLAEANGCDDPEDLGGATAVLLCDITQSYGDPFVVGEFCCAEVFCYCGDSGG